jgi:molybdopterin/thiamine biosynthesis adenylyltransferase/nitroreductase
MEVDTPALQKVEALGFRGEHHFREVALARNLGLFTAAEQERLRQATVAIPGLGGVGGIHFITLVRMGIGRFHLADPDTFEPANVNRQYGAAVRYFGRSKIAAMAEEAQDINPYLKLHTLREGVTEDNLDDFLRGVDAVVDGMDFFNFAMRQRIFKRAWERGIPVVTAGPLGFSTALLIFDPGRGMDFDTYFGIRDDMALEEKLLAFLVGLAPRATQAGYIDPASIDLAAQRGPSLAAGCTASATAACTEIVRILLGKPGLRPAPYYAQYDPFARRFIQGRLAGGNRHPVQRFKMALLKRRWLNGHRWPAAERGNPPLVSGAPPRMPAEVQAYVTAAAAQAPSGDNCQPWRLQATTHALILDLNPREDDSLFNVAQRASLIACGAALENACLAAARYGFQGQAHYFPAPQAPWRCARVAWQQTGREEDPLLGFVWERHTNRTAYDRRPIADDVLQRLRRQAEVIDGAAVQFFRDRESLREIADLVHRADCIRVENRALHAHLMRMLRFTAQEARLRRDGLPLANLEAGKGGEIFLRLTRRWAVMRLLNTLGAARQIAGISRQAILCSSAVGLLSCRGTAPLDFLEGGRALQRLWLEATRQGLSFQPMTAVTLFRLRWRLGEEGAFSVAQRRRLEDLWPAYDRLLGTRVGHVMLFRIGYGGRIACRTPRRTAQAA